MADSKQVLKVVLYISLAFNFILFVCFIVLQYHKTGQSDDEKISGNDKNSVCFSCDYLGKDIKKEETLYSEIVTTKCGHRVCCIENGVMKNLISQMMVSPKVASPDLAKQLDWWRQRNNSAHLFIRETSSREKQKVDWIAGDNYGLSFTNGVTHVDNALRVPLSGIYFVYSGLTLDFGPEKKVPIVYHQIQKRHPILRKTPAAIVLANKYGGSVQTDKQFFSFLCGAVYLPQGFQVETIFSDPIYIQDDEYSSYFGIFKL